MNDDNVEEVPSPDITRGGCNSEVLPKGYKPFTPRCVYMPYWLIKQLRDNKIDLTVLSDVNAMRSILSPLDFKLYLGCLLTPDYVALNDRYSDYIRRIILNVFCDDRVFYYAKLKPEMETEEARFQPIWHEGLTYRAEEEELAKEHVRANFSSMWCALNKKGPIALVKSVDKLLCINVIICEGMSPIIFVDEDVDKKWDINEMRLHVLTELSKVYSIGELAGTMMFANATRN